MSRISLNHPKTGFHQQLIKSKADEYMNKLV